MNFEELRSYCLSKKAVTESFPFDEHTLVFKVMGKMFAITGLNNETCKVNLKCTPEYALELREQYPEVQPGWHMNKTHWNTVDCEGDLNISMLKELIDLSYELIVASLPKKQQRLLEEEI